MSQDEVSGNGPNQVLDRAVAGLMGEVGETVVMPYFCALDASQCARNARVIR